MKRFWLVLLSVGLVMAFSASAFAVDVKFGGSMYFAGMYLDKTQLNKTSPLGTTDLSTAYYFQRLRIDTEFVAAPGFSVVTRNDIMDRILGGARSTPAGTNDSDSNGTRAENENIAFDMAYIKWVSPIGVVMAGYVPFGSWGTVFNNSGPKGVPGFMLVAPVGNWTFAGLYFKVIEGSKTLVTAATAIDRDYDLYLAYARYAAKNVEAGVIGGYGRIAATRAAGYDTEMWDVCPYFKVTVGPVYIEGEFNIFGGKDRKYDNGTADIDAFGYQGYIFANVTLGPAYFGGTFAYWKGDDPNDTTKTAYNGLFLGPEWSPALIMWNKDRAYTFGNLSGANAAARTTPGTNDGNGFGASFQNAYFWQVRAGVKPIDKLDIQASLSGSVADQNPAAGWVSKDMGYEVDVTGTYKISNNLTYMLGFGYLFAGDYFKGTNSSNSVQNDYLVINKLTLTF
jgi:hypothetical protein